jgi:hypothetical protein
MSLEDKYKEESGYSVGKIHDVGTVYYSDDYVKWLEDLAQTNNTELLVDETTSEIDEWYGDWHTCPKCKSTDVRGKARYCDKCGQKLKYKSSQTCQLKNR